MSKTAAVALLLVTAACGSQVSPGPALSSRLASGSITGSVGYPAGVLPAQTIYSIATDRSRFYMVETAFGQRTYTMLGVAPGDYYVFSVAPDFLPYQASSSARSQSGYRFPAGYTKAVPCGLSISCTDHTPISVHVAGGATTSASIRAIGMALMAPSRSSHRRALRRSARECLTTRRSLHRYRSSRISIRRCSSWQWPRPPLDTSRRAPRVPPTWPAYG